MEWASRQEVVEQVIARAISLVEENVHYCQVCVKPLRYAKNKVYGGAGLRVTAAYAGKSIDHVCLRDSFDALASAEKLPYSKPLRKYISTAQQNWGLTL